MTTEHREQLERLILQFTVQLRIVAGRSDEKVELVYWEVERFIPALQSALDLEKENERLNGLIESLKHSCDERVENERNLIGLVKHLGNRVSDLAAANKTIAEQCKRLNDEREYYQCEVEQLHDRIEQLKERNSILHSTLSLITGPSPMSFDHQTIKWIRDTGKKAL